MNVDVRVAKISGAGDVQWTYQWEASGFQEAMGIAADGADDIVLVGQFADVLPIAGATLESAGARDAFVAKLGQDGSPPE
jgi:hypothetical protein